MDDTRSFLARCDELTNGKTLDVILLEVIALIGDYRFWCQDAQACTTDRRPVRPRDPNATFWSIEGAIGYVSNQAGVVPPFIVRYLDALVLEITGCGMGVGWFNDTYDHGTVIDFLEEAYRRLP
jgi:hypothetical protein